MKRVYEILTAFFTQPQGPPIAHKTIGTDPEDILPRIDKCVDEIKEKAVFHEVRRTVLSTLLCPHNIPTELPCRRCMALRVHQKPL